MSAEQVEQRRVFGATRESRAVVDLVSGPSFGGEFAGVVATDEDGESSSDEDESSEWRRRRNGNLKLGSRYVGKIGLVAEMPLSRTISAVRKMAIVCQQIQGPRVSLSGSEVRL